MNSPIFKAVVAATVLFATLIALSSFAAACPLGVQAQCVQQVQAYAAPVQVQAFVQPQVQYFQAAAVQRVQVQQYVAPQPVIVQRQVAAYSAPVLVQRAYAPVAAVQVQAVAAGRQRGRFALRPRLQRAANIGASAATGLPPQAVRVVR